MLSRFCNCYKPEQCYGGCFNSIKCRGLRDHLPKELKNALRFWSDRAVKQEDDDE
jgi:hypothetical protein